jgi:hypothetical protein
MFKLASKVVCTSTVMVSPDPLSPTPSTSSDMKALENTEGLMTLSKQIEISK